MQNGLKTKPGTIFGAVRSPEKFMIANLNQNQARQNTGLFGARPCGMNE